MTIICFHLRSDIVDSFFFFGSKPTKNVTSNLRDFDVRMTLCAVVTVIARAINYCIRERVFAMNVKDNDMKTCRIKTNMRHE